MIPINSILVAIFLLMEARRYRYYEIWSSRVRILETGYFAHILTPENRPTDEAWAEHLAADLITPHFTITEWEAVGRRLRRNYLWIFALLALSWNLKVYLSSIAGARLRRFYRSRHGRNCSRLDRVCDGNSFQCRGCGFAIGTVRLREATGEVLPKHEFSLRPLKRMTSWTAAQLPGAPLCARNARANVFAAAKRTTSEFKKIDISETPDKRAIRQLSIGIGHRFHRFDR